MLKLTDRPKTTGDHFKKNMAFCEGNKLLAGDFRANLDETNAEMVQFTKKWKGNGLPNTRDTWQKVCSYKYQFCTKIFASSRLVSQIHMMARQKIKKKYLMCQIPIKMVKQHAISNSNLHNLNIYSSKGCRKTSQTWIKST